MANRARQPAASTEDEVRQPMETDAVAREHRLLRYLLIAAKVALSAGLIYYAFGKIDISDAWRQIAGIRAYSVAATAVLLGAQLGFSALRLSRILASLGCRCRLSQALDVAFIGAFFSQAFISFVGGDAMRIWGIVRAGAPVGLAARAVVLDRVAGLAGMLILVLLTLPSLLYLVRDPGMRVGLLAALVMGIAGFVALGLLKHMPRALTRMRPVQWLAQLSATALSFARSPRTSGELLGLSIIIQIFNVGIFYVIAAGLSVDIRLWQCLLLVPPVMFLSMLPISFAGWGVREGAVIVAFSLVGVPAGQIVTVSVFFGLSVLAVSLPGALLWLVQRGQGMSLEGVEWEASIYTVDKTSRQDMRQ